MAIAIGQLTITDLNDITTGTTAPLSPTVNQLWLDTSSVPNLLKTWNGTVWFKTGANSLAELDPTANQTIITNTADISASNTQIGLKVSTTTYTTKMSSLDGSISGINSTLTSQTGSINVLNTSITDKVSSSQLSATNGNVATAQAKADLAFTNAGTAQTQANAGVANALTANNLLADIASDSKLTAIEKQTIKLEWDSILSEKIINDAQADIFTIVTEKGSCTTAYNALSAYITPLVASLITTSDVVGTTFRSNFKAYYDARATLLNAIAGKAKTLADNAQGKANTASQSIADMSNDAILTPSEKIQLKKEWAIILSEKPTYDSLATTYAVTTEKTNYGTAYTNLDSALNNATTGYLLTMTGNTTIVGDTFRALVNDYYNKKALLTKVINETAKTQADLGVANASTAQGKADTAFANAGTAQTQANLGVTNASIAKTQADLGVANASTAKTQADLGVANALTAQTQANLGVTNAGLAQTQANLAITNAGLAQGTANTAKTYTDNLMLDSVITQDEKLRLKQEWDLLVVEGTPTTGKIPVQAIAFAVSDVAFDTAYDALKVYLLTTINVFGVMTTVTTGIVRTTWDTKWKDYYNARTDLLNLIATTAKARADLGVSNASIAQTQANLGVTNASTAQTQANLGVTNASTAQTQATLGVTNAGLAQTQATLGVTNAGLAQTQANKGVADASTAQTQANLGVANASTAQARADLGVANALTAQGTANTGVTNAGLAQTQANLGVTNAGIAKTQADLGVANALTAQTQANLGVTNAGLAQTTANTATTNAGIANGLLTDLSDDNKITPNEKGVTLREFNGIVAEKPLNDTQATTFGITTEKTNYDTSYTTLYNYVNPLLTTLTTTDTIVGTTFRANFSDYYTKRTTLLNAIAIKAKSLADTAQTQANTATTNASTAQTQANLGVANASTAQTQATLGVTNAGIAKTQADLGVANALTAQGTANTAQTQANLGVTNAGLAQTQANLGVANALTAKTQADVGVANALTAQTQANLGVTNAGLAQTTANTGVANALTANNSLSDIANDNKITPNEKGITLREWNGIIAEKPLNDTQATTFGITTELTAYDNSYSTLNTYITPLLATLSATDTIVGTTFRTNFSDYYTKRTTLLNAIAIKAKSLADTAQTQATLGVTNANTAQTQANLGVTNAGLAKTQADLGVANALTAQTQANTAITNAGLAKTQADLGVANALTAQTQATLGVTNAGLAQTQANTATANALTAQTQATLGVTNAGLAQTTANTATTNASTANALLTDLSNDNKITPNEKGVTLREFNGIVAEKPLNDAQATTFGITTEKTNYGTSYTTLYNYVNPLLTTLSTTDTIVGTTFRANFSDYYTKRTTLLNAIAIKSKSLADTAQTQANTATTNASTAQTQANLGVTNASTAQTKADLGVANALTAQTQANLGVANALTAQTSANTAQTRADLGVTNAGIAKTQADLGVANALTAQTQATLGVNNASTAQTQANLGVTNAGVAKTQADLGVANALTAQTQANLGVTNASTALTQANLGVTNAGLAQGTANTAKTYTDNLMLDSVITQDEKLKLKMEWDLLVIEGTVTTGKIPVQAIAFGVSHSTYDTAYEALRLYLVTTINVFGVMTTVTTGIVRTTWDTKWKDYYNARTDLLNLIATTAKTRADLGVTNASTAQTQANLGVTNASTAQTQATLGVTNAGIAQTQANLGVTNASTAQTKADLGVANALTAQTQANLGVTNAGLAQTGATTANKAITDMSDDNIMTPIEKSQLKKEWAVIIAEKATYDSLATFYAITTEKTNYDTAYTNLDTPLNNVTNGYFLTMLANTTIVGTTFRGLFDDYYDKKALLISMVNQTAKTRAELGVTNAGLAQTQANLGVTNAGLAKTQADLGVANALTAQTQANLGVTNAGLAQTQASLGVTNAGLAQGTANTAKAYTDNLMSDAVITQDEKVQLKREWDLLVVEGTPTTGKIPVNAIAIGVADTAFDTAYEALRLYLVTTVNVFGVMTTPTTGIVRATWDTKWKDYYNARTDLINLIATTSKAKADLGVTNAGLAQTQANLGVTNAGLAQTQANLGVTNAGLAKTQADLGVTNAGLAQTSVNNMVIGGRNLLTNSANASSILPCIYGGSDAVSSLLTSVDCLGDTKDLRRIVKTVGGGSERDSILNIGELTNRTFTYSTWVKSNTVGVSYTLPVTLGCMGDTQMTGAGSVIANPTTWTRYVGTKTYTTTTVTGIQVYFMSPPAIDVIFCDSQLEEGTKVTNWTPAVEDIQTQLDYAKGTADDALNGADDASSRLDTAEESIIQTSKSIESMVTSDTYNALADTVAIHTTFINQVDDMITTSVSSVTKTADDNGTAIEEMKTYMQFDASGLVLGQDGGVNDNLKVKISNAKMSFLDNGVEVASVSGQLMTIDKAKIGTSIIVGNHTIEKYDANITIIKWIG